MIYLSTAGDNGFEKAGNCEEQHRRIRIAAGVLALGVCLLAAVLILGRKKKRPAPEPPRETPAQTE
ncbi:MAG: hypothetical protein SOY32_03570 [Candidatus Faecousia sp.]|nr:hypothetical protein [Candidatus Faecousia sp.]